MKRINVLDYSVAFLLVILCSSGFEPIAQAQNLNCNGEVIFELTDYQGSNNEVWITVTLDGAVFNEDGDYKDILGVNPHPQAGTYSTNNLDGTTNVVSDARPLICWESVYPNDNPASNTICNGMIGWGYYAVDILYDDGFTCHVVPTFYLNLIDGNWMKGIMYNNYPVDVFNFNVVIDISGNLSVYLFDPTTGGWLDLNLYLSSERVVSFWDKPGNSYNRNRDDISIIDKPFIISGCTAGITQEGYSQPWYPFFCNKAVIDVNIAECGSFVVDVQKTIVISDFTHGAATYPTNIKFNEMGGIIVKEGTLELSGKNISPLTLILEPKTWNFHWRGILGSYRHFAPVYHPVIHANYAGIIGAEIGIRMRGQHASLPPNGQSLYLPDNNSCVITGAGFLFCNTGISLEKIPFKITSTNHSFTKWNAIEINGQNEYRNNCNKIIDSCYIYGSGEYGINVVGIGPEAVDAYPEPNIMQISNSHIQLQGKDGVKVKYSTLRLLHNYIDSSGYAWRNGRLSSSTVSTSGLYGYFSDVSVHDNTFRYNKNFGVEADVQSFFTGADVAFKANSSTPLSEEQKKGLNCFQYNGTSIGVNKSSSVTRFPTRTYSIFGQEASLSSEDPSVGPFINWGGFNALMFPNDIDDNSTYNFRMWNKSSLYVCRNMWSHRTWQVNGIEPKYFESGQIFDYDSVKACGYFEIPVGSGGISDSESAIIGYIANGLHSGELDSVMTVVYDALCDADSSVIVSSFGNALYWAYVYKNETKALDSLQWYGMNLDQSRGVVTDKQLVLLNFYLKALWMTGQYELSYSIADSLMRKTYYSGDSLKARFLQAIVISKTFKDTLLALSVLDSLHARFPYDANITDEIRYLLGSDSLYEANYYIPKYASSENPRVFSSKCLVFPNPCKDRMVVLAPINGEESIMKIQIFNLLGRALYEEILDHNYIGNIAIPPHWENGVYIVVIKTDIGNVDVKKILLVR